MSACRSGLRRGGGDHGGHIFELHDFFLDPQLESLSVLTSSMAVLQVVVVVEFASEVKAGADGLSPTPEELDRAAV